MEDKKKYDKIKKEFDEKQKKAELDSKKLSYQKSSSKQSNDDYYASGKYYYRQSGLSESKRSYYTPGAKVNKDDTAKDVNYYSFLCSQYDTTCDPCDLKSRKKARCPAASFCFEKKGAP